jgi:hypothetical protein
MQLQTYTLPEKFLSKALPALRQNEAANNLMLGVSLRLQKNPNHYGPQPFMATVDDHAGLVAAALMTPPFNLIVHCVGDDCSSAFTLAAQELKKVGWQVPGVLGHSEHARAFAQAWQRITAENFKLTMHMRTFELRQVIPPPPTPGYMRPATLDDLSLAEVWETGFIDEAIGENEPHAGRLRTRQRIESHELFF